MKVFTPVPFWDATTLIQSAVTVGATSIFLSLSAGRLMVRYRIEGNLFPLSLDSVQEELARHNAHPAAIVDAIKQLAGIGSAECDKPEDGAFTMSIDGTEVSVRVAAMPARNTETLILKIDDLTMLYENTPQQLGLTHHQEWQSLASEESGLILVCGATGSGRTTLLYATAMGIDRQERKMVTIEDPIERHLPDAVQLQVSAEKGFMACAASAEECNPAVVIVGELRDPETAAFAVRMASSGHLVYAGMHCGNHHAALARLASLGVCTEELGRALKGVLSLCLIRRSCDSCSGAGCEACNESGYKHRTLVSELVRFQGDIANPQMIHSFAEDAAGKVAARITDRREAERVIPGYDRC